MGKWISALFLLALLALPQRARGDEIPPVLNADLRTARKSRVQVGPMLGPYFADTTSASYVTGFTLTYNWSRHFFTSFDLAYSPLEVDPASAYGRTVSNDSLFHLDFIGGGVVPAAIKVSHYRVLEMDAYAYLGAGYTKVNTSELGNGTLGLGTLFYLKPPWFAIRAEARGYIYKLPINPGGWSFDAALIAGPTFLFVPALL